MTQDEFDKLQIGDVLTNKASGNNYSIVSKINDGYIAIRTITVTSACEWDLLHYPPPKPDPFNEWHKSVAVNLEHCGHEDDLRLAFEAGMKAKQQ